NSTMRIFLTGGTGYVGSAVLDSLVRAGHRVDALVRNAEKAAQVQARGAHPVVGELGKVQSYAQVAGAADGVVHTALDYSGRGPQNDRAALDTFLTPTLGRQRLQIYASGLWILRPCPAPADESAPLNPVAPAAWRRPHQP